MNDRLPAKSAKGAKKKRSIAPVRRAANVSVSTVLIEQARRLGINLSQTLEERLSELVRGAEAQVWLAENQKAIDACNQRIEKQGVFTEKAFGTPIRRINPVFAIGRRRVDMPTAELAGIPVSRLGAHTGSLATHLTEILAALDLFFPGTDDLHPPAQHQATAGSSDQGT